MSKRTTQEQKRKIILGVLHETKEPYALPDLESAAAERGVGRHSMVLYLLLILLIVRNTVKDIVVNEAEINREKIGNVTVTKVKNVIMGSKDTISIEVAKAGSNFHKNGTLTTNRRKLKSCYKIFFL